MMPILTRKNFGNRDTKEGQSQMTGGDYTIGGEEDLYEESFENNIGEIITDKYNSVIKLKADTMNGKRSGAAANMTALKVEPGS